LRDFCGFAALHFITKTAPACALVSRALGEKEARMKQFILIGLLSISFRSFAVNDFECIVKEVYKLNETGLLAPGKGFVTPDVGTKFMVNRQSGQITGKKITNTMSGYMPIVYSYLPSENSYSALTVYKP